MKLRSDGSVQSGSAPTADRSRKEDFGLYRCVVTKVIYVDDAANISSNSSSARIMYDVVVLGGYASGQIISNCRLSSDLGGESGFYERVLRYCSSEISRGRLSDADGDIVYVQFIQGHTGYPVITALDNGIHTSDKIGASSSVGPRMIREYNGVRETINNSGEWIQEVKGGTAEPSTGKFTASASPLVSTVISKDEKYTQTFRSGLNLVIDGAGDTAVLTTRSGVKVNVNGAGNKITLEKGGTIIELDGNGDKISLKGGFVDLGSSVSDFVTMFTELATAFNSHYHLVPQAPSGTLPSQPPAAPLPQSVGSTTVKVQA